MPRTNFTPEELEFLSKTRVARLATADKAGQPHVIPIVFATDGRSLYTPLDKKPKRIAPNQLKRVRNLLENPKVAFVIDHWDEDWTKLAWLMVRTMRGTCAHDIASTISAPARMMPSLSASTPTMKPETSCT